MRPKHKETYYAVKIGRLPSHLPYFALSDHDQTIPAIFLDKLKAKARASETGGGKVVKVEIREV